MVVVHIESSTKDIVFICLHASVFLIAFFLVCVPFEGCFRELTSHESNGLDDFVLSILVEDGSPSIVRSVCLDDESLVVVGKVEGTAVNDCLFDVIQGSDFFL